MKPALCCLAAVSVVVSAQTTPTYYWRYSYTDSTDATIGFIDGVPDQLMTACNANPACAAFNSAGFLKAGAMNTTKAIVDLFVKSAAPAAPALSIWPWPTSIQNGRVMRLIPTSLNITATTPSPDLAAAFARYLVLMFPTAPPAAPGSVMFSSTVAPLTQLVVSVVNVSVPLQLGVDESYTLTVPESEPVATLVANTVYGALRGLETFSQLVHFDFELGAYRLDYLPLTIQDAPAFAYRGILIDTSRHFQPVNTIKAIIDSMTYAKMNVLHWHLVDYQSWPVQSFAYPLLWSASWSPRERYTLADVAVVVEYARSRGVMVIPEFDTPGHADAVCVGYPDACPAPNCTAPLNPASPTSLAVVSGVIQEWASIFPSRVMHLGGDEVDTSCWAASPSIMAWLAAHNLTLDGGYEYFVLAVDAAAAGAGKTAMRWEEVWNHFGTALPKDTIIHVWLDHATLANVTGSGYYGVLSDNDVYYLDHLDVIWSSFYDNDLLQNIAPAAVPFVLGGETCMWGETADTSDVLQTIWPRAAAAAERQWSYYAVTNSSDPAVFQRLADFRCLLNSRGVPAAPVTNIFARSAPNGPGSCEWQ